MTRRVTRSVEESLRLVREGLFDEKSFDVEARTVGREHHVGTMNDKMQL